MERPGIRAGFAAGLAVLALALIWFTGCGTASGPDARPSPEATGGDQEIAQRLFAQLQWEHSAHRYRKVLDIAASLLDYHQGFPRQDEVLRLAMSAAHELAEPGRSLALVEEFRSRCPDSPLLPEVLRHGTLTALSVSDTLAAAGYLVQLYDHDPAGFDPAADSGVDGWSLAGLRPGQLQQVSRRYRDSRLSSYLGFLQVRGWLTRGAPNRAKLALDRLEEQVSGDEWTRAARAMVEGKRVDLPAARSRQPLPTQADLVGVLSPLTGRYALLGNACYEATLLAVQAANAETGREFRLQVEDTQGDPVVAALSARRLCRDSGCIAVLGSLMSSPTTAAAVVTDSYGIPLVSPTATNDNIWQLGDTVFQTNLTGVFETRLLAQLGVSLLRKQRYAIIHAEDAESLRQGELFAAALSELGAEVVATVAFPTQQTDFKEAILTLRRERPEVIFTPATVDQMVLLGPQLDFFRAGALVMGLSAWNSEKLLERAGTVLERAVFPSDLALFPDHWTDEFNAAWQGEDYPREATILAQRVYQAMRMMLDTLQESGARTAGQLKAALRSRCNQRDVEADGPESFASTMRMISGGRIVPFPGEVFSESWALARAAEADSSGQDFPEMDDSLRFEAE